MKKPKVYSDAKRRAFSNRSAEDFEKDFVLIPEHPCEGSVDADKLFERVVPYLHNRNIPKKRFIFYRLLLAGKLAASRRCQIAYSRYRPKSMEVAVVEAAVKAGFFYETRSVKGGKNMSRLTPTKRIKQATPHDPWEVEPNEMTEFVKLRDREDKEELEVDWNHQTVEKTNRKLKLVNAVNSRWTIEIEPFNDMLRKYDQIRRLRPILYAVFNGDYDNGGRLYTGGKHGHQQFGSESRRTITFNGEPSVELDFSGMHPRMLYHIEGIEFKADPYALWDAATTDEHRLIAKRAVNTAINATDMQKAVAACNRAMSKFGKVEGQEKSGKTRTDADKLYRAVQSTGLDFKRVIELAEQKHPEIAHHFNTGAGLWLMRIDSRIALRNTHWFAKQGIPCLPVHDSFIVPKDCESKLRRTMIQIYEKHLGFVPLIK